MLKCWKGQEEKTLKGALGRRHLHVVNFNLNFNRNETVTMLEFRKNAEGILRRVRRGERFVLSHRGHAAARLEPISTARAATRLAIRS